MSNLLKRTSVALAALLAAAGLSSSALANSVTLSQSGGLGPSSYSSTSVFTVKVFANLGPTGGGLDAVNVSLVYDPSVLTATACAETSGLTALGDAFYASFIPECGAGSPGNGGVLVMGTVSQIEQAKAFGVTADWIRMDSTLIGSNIANCCRLQLIVGCLRVFWKSLTEAQRTRASQADRSLLDPFLKCKPYQFVYRLQEDEKPQKLEALGYLISRLLRIWDN